MAENDLDLSQLVASIKPSVVTPHLAEVVDGSNEKKLKNVAKIIVKHLADEYNQDTSQYKTPKMIIHDHKAVAIRFLNVEPLLSGVWAAMSLCILSLSYGEQSTLIESIYPKTTQLSAKAFAAVFANDQGVADPSNLPKPSHTVHETEDVMDKLDSANAGIAIIMAMMTKYGYQLPNSDTVNDNLDLMNGLVDDQKDQTAFKQQTKRKQQTDHYRDKGGMQP